jgi:hypothetical protein
MLILSTGDPMQKFFLLALSILFYANAASAGTTYYDSMSRGYNNPSSALLGTMINNNIINSSFRSSFLAKLKNKPGSNQQTTTKTKPADYRLTDFPAGRKTMADQFVKKAEGLDSEQRKELLKLLTTGVAAVEKELPRKNNIAYAMAGIVGISITISRGVDVPDTEVEQLAAGFNEVLGAAPEWKKAPAKEKQTLYESMLLSAVLMVAGAQSEDQESKDMASGIARNILASFGVK